jgi:DNA-binding transcriptional MerR regulator
MAHEIAKLMLEHAGTFLERTEAVRVAISVGMPLNEIEEYLDWLDATLGRLLTEPDKVEPDGEEPAGD